MIGFRVQGQEPTLPSVVITSEDDYFYFRDSIHAALESGEFGCRFPTFLRRFVPAVWPVDELEALQSELETIAQAFRGLPPEPFDTHWAQRAATSGTTYESLCAVYVDAAGRPLLAGLIDLCRVAREQGRGLRLD